MKKIACVLLSLVMLLCLAACGSQQAPAAETPVTEAPAESASAEPAATEAPEQTFHLKFNTTAAANETKALMTDKFFEMVTEQSGGTITGEQFTAGTLFSVAETLPAIISGDLEMCATEAAYLTDYMPEAMAMLGSCYIYRDYDHWQAVWSDPAITGPLFDEIAEKVGFRVLGTFYTGSRALSLVEDKEITCRADLDGVQLRVANSASWIDMGNALGVDPVPMALNETYLALSTGAVEGQDNPLPATMKNGFGEVCKSITMSKHIIGTGWFGISEAVWQQMSDNQKQIMSAAAAEVCAWCSEQYVAEENALIAEFEAMGVKVYQPDMSTLQAEVMEYYLNEVGVESSWDMDLYNQIQAK